MISIRSEVADVRLILPILLLCFVYLHLVFLIDGHSRAISGKETRRAATNLIVQSLNHILIVHLEEMEEYNKEK
jgi:hypothetical protein